MVYHTLYKCLAQTNRRIALNTIIVYPTCMVYLTQWCTQLHCHNQLQCMRDERFYLLLCYLPLLAYTIDAVSY